MTFLVRKFTLGLSSADLYSPCNSRAYSMALELSHLALELSPLVCSELVQA